MQLKFLSSSSKLLNILKMRGISVQKFGGIEEMVLSDSLPIPECHDEQVLVRLKFSGVNPVDTYIRGGAHKLLPPLPFTPGKDGAGIVEEVGKNVKHFKKGDRVYCTSLTSRHGTLAEFMTADLANVFPLSPSLSFEQGAAIPVPYFTAYRALFLKGNAKEGSRVLVHGASGAVGLAAVQIAKSHGMIVVGTAGTAKGMDLVKEMGADAVYNHRDQNYIQQMEQDLENKFDVILEMLANVNLAADLSLMGERGTTVVIGCRGDIKISPRLLMLPESTIVGCALHSSTPEEWKITSDAILDGIKDGWVKPVISKIYPLEKAGQAHHDIIHSDGASGKLVVKIEQ